MPLYDFLCEQCNAVEEHLVEYDEFYKKCSICGKAMKRLIGAPNVVMTGYRAANGYGTKFIDTPAINNGTGYSFNGNDHNEVHKNHD